MAKYRKKPVIIDAVTVKEYIELNFKDFNGVHSYYAKDGKMRLIRLNEDGKSLTIETLEGNMIADPDDYIITGVNGERYPCKPDIFHQTYELIKE
ncbi:hypothetical protein EDM57_04600 [Brevibacillus gelatini]|uniref:Uncharacterized protein n=1 Tax=Brevibacillus gelatini TaxID=1655277 RepID=A0A3M8B7L0_9BACL|nr:hypothetical protein [Brevibacillus gelatini]RNB59426.1 hypothetical protein EDM57_04600 [Brevibacillus gelatini]